MPVPFKPEGTWTALVTPFTSTGKLDIEAFRRLIEFQILEGITGIVPAGTTGESPTLTWDEHIQVIEQAIQVSRSRVGVLAGTGSNSTDEAIEATRHAQQAGASAALLVDCYYNGPSSLELRTEYYEYLLAKIPSLPIVPYVIPGRSGTALSAVDLAEMHRASPERVPAVKEATGDLERMRLERKLAGNSLAIMSGDDDLTMKMMQDPEIGCSGVISVMTNLCPGPISQLINAQRKGDTAAVHALSEKLAPLFRLVGCKVNGTGSRANVLDNFRNPVPVKTMMAALGMPVGICRRPLGRMSREAVQRCRAALREVFAKGPELLKPIGTAFGSDIGKCLEDDSNWSALTRA